MLISKIDNRPPKVTNPESEIVREILGNQVGEVKSHSLAEATITPGISSALQFHEFSKDTYQILFDKAEMHIHQDLDDPIFQVICVPAWQPDNNFPTRKVKTI